MSRGANFEKFLNQELEACVLDHPLPDHEDGQGLEFIDPRWDSPGDELGGPGSNNWCGVALGCRYSHQFKGRGFNAPAAATRYFEISKTKFLGSETDSSIYTWMIGHTVLEIAARAQQRGDQGNYRLAMDWLRNLIARNLLFYDKKVKRILHVGERSAGEFPVDQKLWQDTMLDAAMGWHHPPKYETILVKHEPILLLAGAEMRSGRDPLDVLSELGFRTIIPTRVAEWPGGKGVWVPGDALNGNTQAVKAAVEQLGGLQYAPRDRGWKGAGDRTHRQKGKPVLLEVRRTDGTDALSYSSPIYDSVEIRIPPPEKRTLDVEIGGTVPVRDLRLPGGTPPDAPPPLEPPSVPPGPQPGPKKKESWIEKMGL